MGMQSEILGHIVPAALLGGLIGFDREVHEKPAGLRTNMVVAAAAAFLVGLGNIVVPSFPNGDATVRTNPIRVIEAVITGISFLGAGSIIRRRGEDQVEGLTTAAGLLMAAAVGMAVALSQYILAVGATLFVLAVLRGQKVVEKWLARNHSGKSSKLDDEDDNSA